jgi:5-formyltetrahydrofolate cyclo-ligase
MENWQEWRKQQRAELIARREAVAAEDHRRWSAAITASLEQRFPLLQKNIVGFCWPYRAEYDPRPAMNFLRAHGAMLALPEVLENGAPLRFRRWWPEAPMKSGAYAIPVPDNTEVVTVGAIIMPMVGFDQQGYRLGYGGGYFDRTLAAIAPRPLTIGVAFEILRLDSVHPQSHDIAMDFIVTEAGIYQVTATGPTLISREECAVEHALK